NPLITSDEYEKLQFTSPIPLGNRSYSAVELFTAFRIIEHSLAAPKIVSYSTGTLRRREKVKLALWDPAYLQSANLEALQSLLVDIAQFFARHNKLEFNEDQLPGISRDGWEKQPTSNLTIQAIQLQAKFRQWIQLLYDLPGKEFSFFSNGEFGRLFPPRVDPELEAKLREDPNEYGAIFLEWLWGRQEIPEAFRKRETLLEEIRHKTGLNVIWVEGDRQFRIDSAMNALGHGRLTKYERALMTIRVIMKEGGFKLNDPVIDGLLPTDPRLKRLGIHRERWSKAFFPRRGLPAIGNARVFLSTGEEMTVSQFVASGIEAESIDAFYSNRSLGEEGRTAIYLAHVKPWKSDLENSHISPKDTAMTSPVEDGAMTVGKLKQMIYNVLLEIDAQSAKEFWEQNFASEDEIRQWVRKLEKVDDKKRDARLSSLSDFFVWRIHREISIHVATLKNIKLTPNEEGYMAAFGSFALSVKYDRQLGKTKCTLEADDLKDAWLLDGDWSKSTSYEEIIFLGGHDYILRSYAKWTPKIYGSMKEMYLEALRIPLVEGMFEVITKSRGKIKLRLMNITENEIVGVDENSQKIPPITSEDFIQAQEVDGAMTVNENGGIDLNSVNVNRTGKTINIQFDPAQLNELEQGDFKGFAPVITGFRYIQSPFPLLGVNIAKE
ncbi:MAG: hypothetical protein WCH62_06245, partial [Candidatus Omnitrophota bacterium]